MKKLTDILKEAGISGRIFTGQSFQSEVTEAKDNLIYVQGIGRYDYKGLKRNVEGKLKDLTKRNKKGDHAGIGKNQISVLSAMWVALKEYEEKNE